MKTLFFWGVFGALMLASIIGLLAAVEYLAMEANKANGNAQPFMFNRDTRERLDTLQQIDMFQALDPLLGYAHSEEEVQRSLDTPHVFLPGFVAYSERAASDMARPFIVTLGGSTTDPIQYSHLADSWPHKLSALLRAQGFAGTVINGGVGGYSSNQELIKFIRDVVELKPDIVICYNGVNDVDVRWAKLPTPMIHSYTKRVFNQIIESNKPRALPFMPNTSLLLSSTLFRPESGTHLTSIVYGVETDRSAGEFLLRNIDMMHALANSLDINFFSVLQPVAPLSTNAGSDWSIPGFYAEKISTTWAEARLGAQGRSYMYDFTTLLDHTDGVYLEDGIHLTSKGNSIVAREIQNILDSRLKEK